MTKTEAELTSYFDCMLVKPRSKVHLVSLLEDEQRLALVNYITASRTATVVRQIQAKGPSENISSELIYFWLVSFRIPFQPTETWHLNRLLALVKIASVKNAPEKKQSRSEQRQRAMSMREINEARLKAGNTKG